MCSNIICPNSYITTRTRNQSICTRRSFRTFHCCTTRVIVKIVTLWFYISSFKDDFIIWPTNSSTQIKNENPHKFSCDFIWPCNICWPICCRNRFLSKKHSLAPNWGHAMHLNFRSDTLDRTRYKCYK